MATELEMRERLNGLDKVLKTFTEEKAELEAKLGIAPTTMDIATKVREQDGDSTLYDRLSPKERTELLQTNPDRFHQILKAKEEAGLRKLFGSPGNLPR